MTKNYGLCLFGTICIIGIITSACMIDIASAGESNGWVALDLLPDQGQVHYTFKDLLIKILPPLTEPPLFGTHSSGWYFGDLHVHTGYSSIAGYDGNV